MTYQAKKGPHCRGPSCLSVRRPCCLPAAISARTEAEGNARTAAIVAVGTLISAVAVVVRSVIAVTIMLAIGVMRAPVMMSAACTHVSGSAGLDAGVGLQLVGPGVCRRTSENRGRAHRHCDNDL